MDELFELLTLVQLCKLPSMAALPSPIILVNYDGFFDGLVKFLRVSDTWIIYLIHQAAL